MRRTPGLALLAAVLACLLTAGPIAAAETGTYLQGPTLPEQAFLNELFAAAGADAPMLRNLGVKDCSRVAGSVGNVKLDVETYGFTTVDRAFSAFSFMLKRGAKALAEGDLPGCYLQDNQVVFWSDRTVIRTTFLSKFGPQLFSYVEWLHKQYPSREDSPPLALKAPRRNRWGASFRLALADIQADELFPSLPTASWRLDEGNQLYLETYLVHGTPVRAGWVVPKTPAERLRLQGLNGEATGLPGETLEFRACGDALSLVAGALPPPEREALFAALASRYAWNLKGDDPDVAGSFRRKPLTTIDLFFTGIQLIGLIFGLCAILSALGFFLWFFVLRRHFRRAEESSRKSALNLW